MHKRSVGVGNWFSELKRLSLSGSDLQPSKSNASKFYQTVVCDLIYALAVIDKRYHLKPFTNCSQANRSQLTGM